MDLAWLKECKPGQAMTKATLDCHVSDAKKTGYTVVQRSTAKKMLSLAPESELKRKMVALVADTTIGWEAIAKVEPAETETVYDLEVPETKVFALSNGLIVFDTINLHVPSMDDAVQEAKDKLLPSKMLFSDRDYDKVMPVPKHESVIGTFASNIRPATQTHQFPDRPSALSAIKGGKVRLNDEVKFPGSG
jgi:hypothetical protein